jgi:hypothetical protein
MNAWYRQSLRRFGLALMIVGFSFFAMAFPTGAPVVPWAGLILAFVGAWIGFSNPGQKQFAQSEKLD